MSINYRVEIDGKIVWSQDFDTATMYNFPPEYLARPADPAPGEPFLPHHFLYEGDELVGEQHAFAEEQLEWDEAVIANEESGFNAAMRELAASVPPSDPVAEAKARIAARKVG